MVQILGDKSKPPPNYFSRRVQIRLLLLVMSLGLVIVLMIKASNPDNWTWFTGEPRPKRSIEDEQIDTWHQPAVRDKGDTDTILIIPEKDRDAVAEERNLFPGVEARLLDAVKDNQPFASIGDLEGQAWFNLFEVLASNDSQRIEKASTGQVSFIQLYKQPKEYRGQLVTIKGVVHRNEWYDVPKNRAGVSGYYRLVVWITGGKPKATFVYSLEKPADFPVADKLHEDVRLTGFFFKKWVYERSDGASHLAPVLLAKNFTWTPQPPSGSTISPAQFAIAAAVLLVVAVGFATVILFGSRNLFKYTSYPKAHQDSAESLEKLAREDLLPDVGEQLRHFSKDREN